MSNIKDLIIQVHDELIDQYFETHPDTTLQEAYDATAPLINDALIEKIASHEDYVNGRLQWGNLMLRWRK